MMPKYARPSRIPSDHKWVARELVKSPSWCSVDLRDGNQALPMPMNPERKMEFFKLLLGIGFKDIEISFPSASQDDFDFVRSLIEGDKIPKDVRISVLTQSREHLIQRTVESLAGVKGEAILHLYVPTSDLHGKIVFNRSRKEVLDLCVEGTKTAVRELEKAGLKGRVAYEFSPEEFTDTDPDFALEVCKAVKEAWGPSKKRDFILNLPATVERRPPYQYADLIEYFIDRYPYMAETTISIHAHNDQGCAVAATEMAVMAGAERVEGTLFGHGERTGNVDICTFALNLFARGIDTGLDFSNLPAIVRVVEASTGIDVHERHPYAGQLAFTAFSGSHQDAIRKGMENKDKASEMFQLGWKLPYLHIDPADVGRKYEKLIRINSQSGKGGVAYILEHDYGIYPPKNMHPYIGLAVQRYADEKGEEIGPNELIEIFRNTFVGVKGPFELLKYQRVSQADDSDDSVSVKLSLKLDSNLHEIIGRGNGPLSATVHGIREGAKLYNFILEDFSEKTLGRNADAKAIAFVGVRRKSDNQLFYGAGEHPNIDQAAILALFSALNRTIIDERAKK